MGHEFAAGEAAREAATQRTKWKMHTPSEIIRAEIQDIAQIVRDECWLEGERRGRDVEPGDRVVQARVTEIILTDLGVRLRHQYSDDGR